MSDLDRMLDALPEKMRDEIEWPFSVWRLKIVGHDHGYRWDGERWVKA